MSIIKELLPIKEIIDTNKVINDKIEKLEDPAMELEYMKNYDKLEINTIIEFYSDTFEIKKLFEDKAKNNLIGITISISLFFGLLTIVNSYHGDNIIKSLIVFMSICTIIYMISAGFLSFQTLIKMNKVNKVSPSELTDNSDNKRHYARATEINIKRNTIRNNYVYSSYICIRNSMICLLVLFCIMIFSINDTDASTVINKSINGIFYSTEVINGYKNMDFNNTNIFISKMVSKLDLNVVQALTLYDVDNKTLYEIKVDNGDIYVKNIFNNVLSSK